ncbi:MAG: hypothetical protein ACXWP5_15025, partial [Bdellovibrionota bacterium]
HQEQGSFPPVPTIAQIKHTSDQVLDLGAKYVVQQQQIYKQNNPQAALATSEFIGKNQRRAMEFLYNARAYLMHIQSEEGGIATGHMLKTVNNSLARINSVINTLEKAASDPDSNPGDAVSALADLVSPDSDQSYIPTELQLIVSQDINTKMKQGKIDKNLAMVLQLSTSDSLSEMLNAYGSLEALRNQLRSAKDMTRKNLKAVGGLFAEQIDTTLRDLKKQVDEDPKDEDTRDKLRLFCVQTLLIPEAPKIEGRDLSKYCKGEMYYSLYVKSGLQLDYDKLSQEKFSDRACSLYDFYRKSKIFGIGTGRR